MAFYCPHLLMANRQNAGKSGKGRDGKPDKQIFEQNQLGLKEAFAILQRGQYSSVLVC